MTFPYVVPSPCNVDDQRSTKLRQFQTFQRGGANIEPLGTRLARSQQHTQNNITYYYVYIYIYRYGLRNAYKRMTKCRKLYSVYLQGGWVVGGGVEDGTHCRAEQCFWKFVIIFAYLKLETTRSLFIAHGRFNQKPAADPTEYYLLHKQKSKGCARCRAFTWE